MGRVVPAYVEDKWPCLGFGAAIGAAAGRSSEQLHIPEPATVEVCPLV
jgi:hypothetical protein